jgi:hypothetical protein
MDGYSHHQIPLDSLDEPAYVELPEAAKRMNLTQRQVLHLCRTGALRSYRIPGGLPLVQPAILTGAVPRR